MKRIVFQVCVLIIVPSLALAMEVLFTPGVSVRTTYTDNVDRVPENPEYDYITNISIPVSLDFLGKTSGATIAYTPSRVYYKETRENDFWRHQVSADAYSQLSRRLNFTIGGSFLKSEDPADLDDIDFTVRRGRFEFYSYTANAGLVYQFGERDQLGLGFDYGGTENKQPTLEDNKYYRPSLDFTYWFTNNWGSALSGYYEQGEFDTSDDVERFYGQARILRQFNRQLQGNVQYALNRVLYEGETEDQRFHDISAGFEYQFGQTKGMTLQLGYSVIEQPGRDNETDMSGDFTFTNVFSRGTIDIAASAGYDYSFYSAQRLGLNYYAGGGLTASYQLFRKLSADAYANYRYIEYRDQIPQRDDDRINAGVGLSFQLLQWLYLGAGYSYSANESNIDINDFVDNRVYVSLSATPTQPFRLPN